MSDLDKRSVDPYNDFMLIELEKIPPLRDDDRGNAYGFLNRESSYFIVINRKPGTTSGNHYHKGTVPSKDPETFFLVKGRAHLLVRDTETGKEEEYEVEENTKISIPKNVYHSFTALTEVIFLEMNVGKEDFESDTVRS